MGSPPISAKGFCGRRVEPMRAGTITIGCWGAERAFSITLGCRIPFALSRRGAEKPQFAVFFFISRLGYRQQGKFALVSRHLSSCRRVFSMHGFEFNKLFAAVLVALLVAMISGFLAEKLVSPKMLDQNVYVVEGVAATPGTPTETMPKEPEPIASYLAKADADAGPLKTARVCGTCHSFGKGEPAKIGPNLYGIVGAKHAHMEGFNYSDAMKAMAGNGGISKS